LTLEYCEYDVTDERFGMCRIRTYAENGKPTFFVLSIDKKDWVFKLGNGYVSFVNTFGKATGLKPAPAIGFKNKGNFGSGRGYIWSRTLPLIKDTLLLGHGADTFCIFFPQNDYVGKYNAGLPPEIIVDKPHNMYLQMAVNTGLISLAAFLALLGLYFAQSFKLYHRRNYSEFMEFAGAGIFLGILGFAFSGLFNDSSVSVMPMFYGLLGTGMAINIVLKRSDKKS